MEHLEDFELYPCDFSLLKLYVRLYRFMFGRIADDAGGE